MKWHYFYTHNILLSVIICLSFVYVSGSFVSKFLIAIFIVALLGLFMPGHTRQQKRLYIMIYIGMIIGLQACYRIQTTGWWTGFGELNILSDAVHTMHVVFSNDTKSRAGYSMVRSRLVYARNRDGSTVSSGGEVFLRIPEEIILGKGTLVTISPIKQATGNMLYAKILYVQGFQNKIWEIRWYIHKALSKRISLLPRNIAALLRALFMGIDDDIDPLLKDQFIRSGIMHILALSGMHLAFISGFFMGVLTYFLNVRIARFVTLFVLTFYLILVGIRPSLFRSYLMVLTYMVLQNIGYKISLMDTLALSALLIALIFPMQLESISFQLSFLSLFGILFWTPFLYQAFPSIPLFFRSILYPSLGALLMNFPLLLISFHQIALGTLLWGPLFAFLALLFLWIGALSLLIPFLSVVMQILYISIDWGTYIAAHSPVIYWKTPYIIVLLVISLLLSILRLWISPAKLHIGKENIGDNIFSAINSGLLQ